MAYACTSYLTVPTSASLCACVCVCVKERDGETDRNKGEEGKVGKKGEQKRLNYSY